jgi:ribonuclease P protein component
MYATDLSAAKQAAYPKTRLPGTHEDALGPRHSQPATQEGPPPVGGQGSLEARIGLTAEGLPRRWRLRGAAEIQEVVARGTRRRTSRLEILWCPNDRGHPRLGVIAPRFGHSAVERNRLRRRLREHARRQVVPGLPALDLLVRARPRAYTAPLDELHRDLDLWRATVPSA